MKKSVPSLAITSSTISCLVDGQIDWIQNSCKEPLQEIAFPIHMSGQTFSWESAWYKHLYAVISPRFNTESKSCYAATHDSLLKITVSSYQYTCTCLIR